MRLRSGLFIRVPKEVLMCWVIMEVKVDKRSGERRYGERRPGCGVWKDGEVVCIERR